MWNGSTKPTIIDGNMKIKPTETLRWYNISKNVYQELLSIYIYMTNENYSLFYRTYRPNEWCAILIAHQIVMAKHGGSCVHFSGISTCGRTSRETVSHSQRQPLPTPHKIALPVYVTVTNKRLQPLTTTLYNSLVLSFSLLTTKRRLIKHRSFLCVLRSS